MSTPITDSRIPGENARRVQQRERNPHLFRPITFRSVTARNRIALSPMCQYSAQDGLPNQWHSIHLGARATGGAGIVFTEVVHTEATGRITPHCLGLWNDEQRDAFKPIVAFIADAGAVPAIQIGHAGRKASVGRPWDGAKPIALAAGGWPTVSASSRAYAAHWHEPSELSATQIKQQLQLFADSARRAREAGFQIIELHAAHGYLLHQFLSPLSNHRSDSYGGSFENRIRFVLEAIQAIRSEWPDDRPLFMRVSASDWVEGGWDLADSVRFAEIVKAGGQVDLIDCSSGGNDPDQKIPIFPGYQVALSRAIRQQSGMATGAVGLITTAEFAESILASGDADLVFLGRALLADPAWPLRAAAQLKVTDRMPWPVQYERANF